MEELTIQVVETSLRGLYTVVCTQASADIQDSKRDLDASRLETGDGVLPQSNALILDFY
jgi:hypothetical protein